MVVITVTTIGAHDFARRRADEPCRNLRRVVVNEESPGFGITEKSFLPKGAKPGISAGVPQDMIAMVLNAAKLAGVQLLHQGDKVDLVAAAPVAQLQYFDGLLSGNVASADRPTSAMSVNGRYRFLEGQTLRLVLRRTPPLYFQ